jgi:hypothetical protein
MSARAKWFALLLAAFATITLGPASNPAGGAAAARAGAWSLKRGEYQSEVRAGSFSTLTAYDAAGTRVAFSSPGFKFEQTGFAWRNEIGWRKKLSLRFDLAGILVTGFERTTLYGSPLTTFAPSQSGLSQFDLGLHYNIMNGDRALAFEALWHAPAGYDRELSLALGDGRQELSGQLNVGSTLGKHGFLQGMSGASYRFHKLGSSSTQANLDPLLTSNVYYDFSADLGFWLGRSIMLGGRYHGRMLGSTTGSGGPTNIHTFGPLTLLANEQLDDSAQNAGPFLLWRLDGRLDLTAGSYSTPTGHNTLHFDQYYVSLAFKQSKLKRNQGFLGSSAP